MRRYIPIIVLALLALPLAGCGGLTNFWASSQAVAEKAAENSKPRQRVETLANVLKDTKDGLAAEYSAGRMMSAEFIATKPPIDRATAKLNEAGNLLRSAATDRNLAGVATDALKAAQYQAQSAASEALAMRRADEAEADIAPLRDLLGRVRGVPVAVPVSPQS